MADPTTYPCVHCHSPAERIASATIHRAWIDGKFITQVERIVSCALCQVTMIQHVTITVEDGGETDRRYVAQGIPKGNTP
jgi:hypothetical protein